MSRVAKNPVALLGGVEVRLSADEMTIKGPLGVLKQRVPAAVRVVQENGALLCQEVAGVAGGNALSGTIRALL